MEHPLASIINHHEKLLLEETMRELELTKNVNTELIKLLNIANRERDQAKEQLQILLNNINNNNNNNNLLMFQTTTKANSSITAESNSISHVSSPADSLLFETVSSSHQELNNVVDVGSVEIDRLANGKVLPQKGKLLEAVKNAGPLLKNLILVGPLPTWKNPPPLSSFDHLNNNSFPNTTLNSIQLNLPGGVHSNNGGACSNNNTCLFTSNSSSILKRQRLH